MRLLCLLVAVLLALQVLPERLATPRGPLLAAPGREVSAVLPALSPFLSLSFLLATRVAHLLALLGLPIALLALWRGRWFCLNACPTGLLLETVGRLRPRAKGKLKQVPRLAPWILLLALAGAACGYPFFVWLDPLSLFNGFFCGWRAPVVIWNLLPALGLVAIAGLSIWRPNSWCYALCPLGYAQEALGKFSRLLRRPVRDEVKSERAEGEAWRRSGNSGFWLRLRSTLSLSHPPPGPGALGRRAALAVFVGGAGAWATRRVLRREPPRVLRPPGAVAEEQFSGLCTRCGNCIRACPQRIIYADAGASGLAGLLTPALRFGPGYCHERCNECNRVCPTHAIRHLSLEEKRREIIGTAQISEKTCIQFLGEHCMICGTVCPYQAIDERAPRGQPVPVVNLAECRGCGLCVLECPAAAGTIVIA